jgi:3-oxoacyl-ACP reductase-like protein
VPAAAALLHCSKSTNARRRQTEAVSGDCNEHSWKYHVGDFRHASAAPAGTPATPSATPAPSAPQAPSALPKAGTPVDVADVLTKLAAHNKEKLDWRLSIVDLMKLLNMDSSLTARKQLADELHYTGDKNDSATMNMWLHKQVMQKLADNGGKVPDDLLKK